MIWLALVTVLYVALRAHYRISRLHKELVDARLKTAEMFMKAVACDNALAELVDLALETNPGEYEMSLN